MSNRVVLWRRVFIEITCIIFILCMFSVLYNYSEKRFIDIQSKNVKSTDEKIKENSKINNNEEKEYIKWVDFKVTTEALQDAYEYDRETYLKGKRENWIDILAYLACKYGGDFKKYNKSDMYKIKNMLKNGTDIKDVAKEMKYYSYYQEAYEAVLGGLVGEYSINGIKEYGLKAYFPIAKNFPYSHYDDFGTDRSYGFKRKHLGHDMFGQVGTPIIAVESGYVEALGWNRYGGWRIGIRSFDKKRYYYYAHLRKGFPFNKSLKEGSVVTAGDVIGYMGRTGYSTKEDTNNINISHLHFGIQLIFNECQKEGNNEIWIDCYQLCNFLYRNRCETIKNQETKEYTPIDKIIDPIEKID